MTTLKVYHKKELIAAVSDVDGEACYLNLPMPDGRFLQISPTAVGFYTPIRPEDQISLQYEEEK